MILGGEASEKIAKDQGSTPSFFRCMKWQDAPSFNSLDNITIIIADFSTLIEGLQQEVIKSEDGVHLDVRITEVRLGPKH